MAKGTNNQQKPAENGYTNLPAADKDNLLKVQEQTIADQAKRIEALEAELEETKVDRDRLEQLEAEKVTADAKLADLSGQVPGTFKINKREYRFKKGHKKFHFGGQQHDSAEAIKDEKLMTRLVEIGAGVIEEVTAE